jgi:hypothetical protein
VTTKVFYSWQADRPQALCRTFIKEAIEEALQIISAELQLDESERPEIDHDTKDEPGTVDITNTILQKIEACSVFVGDITPVANSESGKEVANPNVLIELGYALHAKGPKQIVLVANRAFGATTPEKLPFNLRHRRGPANYKVGKGSQPDQVSSQRQALVEELVTRIGACLRNLVPQQQAVDLAWQPSRANDPSLWFEQNTLVQHQGWHGAGTTKVKLEEGPRSYIRLLPDSWSVAVPSRAQVHRAPDSIMLCPLGRWTSADGGQNSNGVLRYAIDRQKSDPVQTETLTQWFDRTGEIWAVDAGIVSLHNNRNTLANVYTLEQWAWFLSKSLALYQHFGAMPPVHVRMGIVGLANTTIGSDAIDDRFEYADKCGDFSTTEQLRVLLGAYNRLLEAYGRSVANPDFVRAVTKGYLADLG